MPWIISFLIMTSVVTATSQISPSGFTPSELISIEYGWVSIRPEGRGTITARSYIRLDENSPLHAAYTAWQYREGFEDNWDWFDNRAYQNAACSKEWGPPLSYVSKTFLRLLMLS